MSYQLRPIQELIDFKDEALREAEDAGVELEAAETPHQRFMAEFKHKQAIQMAAMWGACITGRKIIEQLEREKYASNSCLQAQ